MISMLVADTRQEETRLLIEVSRTISAYSGDENLEIIRWNVQESIDEIMKAVDKLDVAMIDVTIDGGVDVAKRLRKQYPEIEIVIISSPTISPTRYLNPEVKAASLLLKPLDKDSTMSTLQEFFQLFYQEEEKEENYYIDKKGEKVRVPYKKIVYFEARDKRIYARLPNVEYGLYDTMDHLCTVLPEEFIRCHRSFIINHDFIIKVSYSQNYVILCEKMMVPISRSYKAALREVMVNGA